MSQAKAEQLFNELKDLLIEPIQKGDRLESFCPVHEDGTKHGRRSLSLHPKFGLDCFAGCKFDEILAALRARGRQTPSLAERINGNGPAPAPVDAAARKLVATYEYRDINGNLVAIKARFEYPDGKKDFRWRRPDSKSWDGVAPLTMKDLPVWGAFGLEEVRPETPIYICEGEKATQACRDHDLVAVCFPGSSSQKEFGDEQLAVFRGRNVNIWPDNDPPGRIYAQRLHAALKPLARNVVVLNIPMSLPEKGDAADYFKLGGTVEDLEKGILHAVSIDYLSDDSLRVKYPTPAGILTATFSELERTSRALEAELSLLVGNTPEASGYSQRLNLMSASQVTELRRTLQEVYGKDLPWAQILNEMVSLVRKTFTERDPSVEVLDIPDDPDNEPMLIDPLLPDGNPTTFFGDGGSAKSYIVMRLLASFGWGLPFLEMQVPCVPTLYVDYEDNERTFRRRMQRITAGMGLDSLPPMVHYWPAKGIPLPDLVYALRRKVEKDGIRVLVVDSVAPACGGKPEDAEVALRFFRALSRIGVTSILIAHIVKGGNTEYPFGSIFWNNESRKTWYVKRVQEEDSDDIDVGLFNRKVNEGPRSKPVGVAVHFDGKHGPVSITLSNLADIPEIQDERPLKDRIRGMLNRPLTAVQIAELLPGDVSVKMVDKVLRSNKHLFVPVGKMPAVGRGQPAVIWALLAQDDDYSTGGVMVE